ncbi:MAG: amidohydrolase family protein [Acidobacteria bacterium]|nr:amidohydrolase family protein [Acidobacteriota bacterium]
MRHKILLVFLALAGAWAVLPQQQSIGAEASQTGPGSGPAPATGRRAAGRLLAVRAGLLLDGTGREPVKDAVLLIEGDRITAVVGPADIPAGAEVIDASRQVVIPGLIDTHVHLAERAVIEKAPEPAYRDQVRQDLRQNLAFGVTTVFSLGLDRDFVYALRDRSWNGDFDGSRILTAGRGFTAPGGHPTQLGLDIPNQEDDPEQARRRVQQLAARKVDGVKIWFADIANRPDLPQIKADVARAIIDEAHRNRLRALAHINTARDTQLLVKAGLDGITHIARDALDGETIAMMQDRGVIVAPTLVQRKKALIFKEESALLEDPIIQAILGPESGKLKEAVAATKQDELQAMLRSYEQARENAKRLHAAGVVLAVGTDANTAFAPPGLITHKEVEALADSGLSPMEAIVAATRGSAQWAGVSEQIGTLEPGKRADMLILDGNPLQEIRNTRRIAKIIIRGRIVDPSSLRR